ncbi:hypothetical protein BZA70DRAFT_267991 [Myxozyma melibiosi]|uniref:Uncharacterized protein n=1 Tax=Myxozyma melibiosi TaxID=54550 RepID=A0ABR1F4K3_9ASCO
MRKPLHISLPDTPPNLSSPSSSHHISLSSESTAISKLSPCVLSLLPKVDFLKESFRILSFSPSPAVSDLARSISSRLDSSNAHVVLARPPRSPSPTDPSSSSSSSSLALPDLVFSPSSSASSTVISSASSASSASCYFAPTVLESIVPPSSIHCVVALDLLPTHFLLPFADLVRSRSTELLPGGLFILVYPASLDFFNSSVVPLLDPLLHCMLALNKLSTDDCLAFASPPATVPSYADQLDILSSSPSLEVLYSSSERLKLEDWGPAWISHEDRWMLDLNGGQDLIDGLLKAAKNNVAYADVGIHVVRKL